MIILCEKKRCRTYSLTIFNLFIWVALAIENQANVLPGRLIRPDWSGYYCHNVCIATMKYNSMFLQIGPTKHYALATCDHSIELMHSVVWGPKQQTAIQNQYLPTSNTNLRFIYNCVKMLWYSGNRTGLLQNWGEPKSRCCIYAYAESLHCLSRGPRSAQLFHQVIVPLCSANCTCISSLSPYSFMQGRPIACLAK